MGNRSTEHGEGIRAPFGISLSGIPDMESPKIPNDEAGAPVTMVRFGVLFLFALSLSATLRAQGPDFFWNNSAGTGQWNATDANWSGANWAHSPSNRAFFSSVGGTVSLSEAVTAGAVNFGGANYNAPGLTLTNGSLVAAGLTIQGKATNNGDYPANPTLTLAIPAVTVAGDIAVGRANLAITSGTVTADRITSAAASADWARLIVSGGTVTATNGIDGSTHGSVTFAIELNGGTLRTPSIRVADRELGNHNNAWLTFNGGTLKPTADNPDFLTLYGGNQNAYIGNGGAIIDTDGHDIGINTNLLAGGAGGLAKVGQGTLTLAGANSYIGETVVHEGTLRLTRTSSRVAVKPGGLLDLNFSGSQPIRALVIDGVSLPPGVYSASTHPGRLAGAGSLVVSSGYSDTPWPGVSDGVSSFRRMKYGYFVHYVFGGTRKSDGNWPTDANDMANRFDAVGFAEDLHSMGVEYVIFTAWHYNMVCLWPSAAMNQWMPGHTVNRDLLGDLLDAVKAKGIRVLFYTHPRDGHDMSTADQITTGWGPGSGSFNPDWNQFDRAKWNDFINDIYADLIDRYGSRMDGMFIDEGSPYGDSWRVVDYPRLRQTVKSRQPDLLMMQNFYGDNYSCDIGATEVSYWQAWVPGTNPNNWPATGRPMSMVMGSNWSATQVPGIYTPRYNTTEMFRMTVLRAGVNSTDGGGVNWASGPYAGGGWETGVLEQMQEIGSWIAPIRASVCDTFPSQSWITPPNATINSLSNGFVATRSAADAREFIHVLTPPAGNSLTVPAPADGRGYASAALMESGHSVDIVRNGDGSLTLTLQSGDTWNPRDTVIALTPVTVTWNGNGDDAGPGTAAWAHWMDNFTGGVPLESRFRSGDGVKFTGQGAAAAIPWATDFAVGDLRFSGKDYHIQPFGSPTLTLASGRIDVANGITASFDENGPGGPLTLAGSAGLAKTGGGTLVLDLPSHVNGNTILTDGVLAVRSGALGREGNIVFNGGTLRMLPGNREDLSSRIRHGNAPVRIDTGGNDVVWATPLHASNTGGVVKLGNGTLSLAGGGSNNSSFAIDAGKLKLEPATTGSVVVPNPGFESPPYAPQGWSYNPVATGWTFNPSGGTASNNTPWVGTSPEGSQVAFLQNNGTISAEVSVSADGHYRPSFLAANRPNYPATGLIVTLDSTILATFLPGQLGGGGDFNRFTLPAVHITAGTHTLALQAQQNGPDSDTLIDDIRFTAAGTGAFPNGVSLALTGSGAVFDPGPATVTLDSLAGVAGSAVDLTNTSLAITGNQHAATFAGSITGTGSLTNSGTLRLVGDAVLDITGPFTNTGILDIMTWNGTLPAGFVNHGIVLDRSAVRILSCGIVGDQFSLVIEGYAGHSYRLQVVDSLSEPWQDLGPAQTGRNAQLTFTDPRDDSTERRFYRIVVSP
ncbi:MAG: alpha-L-fucosidase [Verrucomicrobia bacterium]|nr:alpha-L-fucosidase [Verrucomicrobiota bacterium]